MKNSLLIFLVPLALLASAVWLTFEKWQQLDRDRATLEHLAMRAVLLEDEKPHNIQEEIESIPLMANAREKIAALSAHPAFSSWEEEFPSHLSFEIHGKEWKQKEDVYLTSEELGNVLNTIESNLCVTSMTLDREKAWKLTLTLQENL